MTKPRTPDPKKPPPKSPTACLTVHAKDGAELTVSTEGTECGKSPLKSWSVTWDDGAATGGTDAPPPTLTHTYARPGEYTVTLNVGDAKGGAAEAAVSGRLIFANVEAPPIEPPEPPVGSGVSWTLDDFENGERTMNPSEADSIYHRQFGTYTQYTRPATSPSRWGIITDATAISGTHVMQSLWDQDTEELANNSGYPAYTTNWQFQCATYYTGSDPIPPPFTQGVDATYKFIQPGQDPWITGRVNRMRLWVKINAENPLQYTQVYNGGAIGYHNFEIATHLIPPGDLDNPWFTTPGSPHEWHYAYAKTNPGEGPNCHFYHFYDLGQENGVWQQVIVDSHYQHQRNLDGGIEWGYYLQPYPMFHPEGVPTRFTFSPYTTLTYFDTICRWYIDMPFQVEQHGRELGLLDFRCDRVEFYEDPNEAAGLEDMEGISNLTGCYNPTDNGIHVGWNRDKNLATPFDIKYAFSDIHTIGWAAATTHSTVPAAASGSICTQYFRATNITVTGHTSVFMGIKRQGQTTFRQIEIPVTLGL